MTELYWKNNYRKAVAGEIPCSKCIYMKIRTVSGRPECTLGPEPHYAVGLKRTCDNAKSQVSALAKD